MARRGLVAALGATGVMTAFDLAQWLPALGRPRVSDFQLYLAAARIGMAQGWPRIYDLALQARTVAAWGGAWQPYLNPPPMAWAVMPLVGLPLEPAFLVWSAFLAASLGLAWWLAAPGEGLGRAVHLLAAAGLFPVAFALSIGQPAPAIAAALAGCWWLERRGRAVEAGLVLSLIAVKPQVALLVPLALIAAGRARLVLSWAAATAAMALGSLALLGAAGLHRYLSALGLASGWSLTQRYAPPGVVGHGPALLLVEAGAVALVALAGWRWRHSGVEVPVAAALAGSFLFTRYIGVQDLTVMVVGAWLVLRTSPPIWHRLLLLAGYVVVELAIPLGPLPIVLWEAAWLLVLALGAPVPQPGRFSISTGSRGPAGSNPSTLP